MNQNELRQTVFNVAPLKNVVGIGKAAAFQIHVQHVRVLATPTRLVDFARVNAANDGPTVAPRSGGTLRSLLSRFARR